MKAWRRRRWWESTKAQEQHVSDRFGTPVREGILVTKDLVWFSKAESEVILMHDLAILFGAFGAHAYSVLLWSWCANMGVEAEGRPLSDETKAAGELSSRKLREFCCVCPRREPKVLVKWSVCNQRADLAYCNFC